MFGKYNIPVINVRSDKVPNLDPAIIQDLGYKQIVEFVAMPMLVERERDKVRGNPVETWVATGLASTERPMPQLAHHCSEGFRFSASARRRWPSSISNSPALCVVATIVSP